MGRKSHAVKLRAGDGVRPQATQPQPPVQITLTIVADAHTPAGFRVDTSRSPDLYVRKQTHQAVTWIIATPGWSFVPDADKPLWLGRIHPWPLWPRYDRSCAEYQRGAGAARDMELTAYVTHRKKSKQHYTLYLTNGNLAEPLEFDPYIDCE